MLSRLASALVAIATLATVCLAADSTSAPAFKRSIEFRGFAHVVAPIDTQQSWQFRRARVALLPTVTPTLDGYVDYEVNKSKLFFIYGRMHRVVPQLDGAEASLGIGQWLSPISNLYPSAPTLQTHRYLAAYDAYAPTFAMRGACATLQRGTAVVRLASFGERQWTATATYRGVSAFWEEGAGYGAAVDWSGWQWWCNLSAAYSRNEQLPDAAHVQQYWQPASWLRAYAIFEWFEGQVWKPTLGLTAQPYKNCFLKAFYDGRTESPVLEAGFYFSAKLVEP